SGRRAGGDVPARGGQCAIIRLLTMAETPDGELERAMTFEVERYLPAGVRDVKHNYRVLGRRPKDGQLEILLVVAAKELVDRHLAPLAVLGLTSAVMEVTPFSMVRAVAPRDGN